MKKLVLVIVLVFLAGCTQRSRSRNFGGTETIKLSPGMKLVEATWKDDNNLWYLIEPMDPDYEPKEKLFIESSSLGVIEGKIIFIESR